MKTKTIILTAIGLTLASLASADMKTRSMPEHGGHVGNGGGTVTCRDDQHHIQSIEVLDFYEARTLRNFQLNIQSIPGDWKQKAQAVIARIESKSELRFQMYSLWLKSFEKESKILTDVEFSTVPDSGYIGVPKGCAFEQAAIQRMPIFTGDARYYLNAELWNAMDDTQKAGLVLHEIIYREAIGYGQTDSIRSRYLTGLYASAQFANQVINDYWKVLEQAHYELTDVIVPDALKGSVKTWFNGARLWQLGGSTSGYPLEAAIPLPDRLLVRLGDCNQDCEIFVPTNFWQRYLPTSTNLFFKFARDIEMLEFAGSKFYADESIPGSQATGSFTLPTALDNAEFFYGPNKAGLATANFSAAVGKLFDMAQAVDGGQDAYRISNANLLQNSEGVWNWNTVLAESINTNRIPEGPHTWLGVNLAYSGNPCMFGLMNYVNGNPSALKAVVSTAAGCESNTLYRYLSVKNTFTNGTAIATLRPEAELRFLPQSPPTFTIDQRKYNVWDSIHSMLMCEPTQGAECLTPSFGPDRVVKSLQVTDASPSLKYGCNTSGASCDGTVQVVRDTTVMLYDSGSVKSFVIGTEIHTTYNGQASVIPVGSTVELDSEGHLSSFH